MIIIISSYNYIAHVWEPIIEKLEIKINGKHNSNDKFKYIHKIDIEISKLSIDISDMAIGFIPSIFNNWSNKFEKKIKKIEGIDLISNKENNNKKKEEINKEKNSSNNQIINYTGTELKIIDNGKQIMFFPSQKLNLSNLYFVY